ncbi:Magnesium transport protein CorA [invertebrate metagenome]|uniref:Magnesium transport protein CorA n=1 Tax=invertebrate metagenome TaxID=1711999 RepID=A0A2H9TAB7_9ZZZZ
MINAYCMHNNHVSLTRIDCTSAPSEHIIWLDVAEPELHELKWLSRYFPGSMPNNEEDLRELEISSRFFETSDGIHIRTLFPHRSGHELRNVNVALTIKNDMLITLQDEPTALFRLMRGYIKNQQMKASLPLDIIIALFDAKVEYLADTLEEIYGELEEASQTALSEDTADVDELLRTITLQEDLNGKMRLNMLDTQRSLRYFLRACNKRLTEHQREQIRDMLRDLESLTPHTAFLFDKINFLMDATMGFINLEQNSIIKIFSVAAVMFMPPTLIASVYGMNFDFMPELHSSIGYPIALGMMLLSAFGTYFFFKRKGWL